MGSRIRYGRQVMTVMELVDGPEVMMEQIVDRVSNGEDPRQIAESWGVVVSVIWEWMRAQPGRIGAYRNALRARADALAHQSLRDVEEATEDTVALARLRSDHRLRVASKWDQETYGESGGKPAGGSTGITVVIDRGVVSLTAPTGETLTVQPEPAALTVPRTLDAA